MYFNDATGAKMNTHLDTRIDLGEVACRNDGRPYYAVDLALMNTALLDADVSLRRSGYRAGRVRSGAGQHQDDHSGLWTA
ncbi:hypothetical protein [Cryobacterium sp. Y50]|uniref:hypothetical protein n=1 Tax=Cryobacterium sp. Y50 TaxID=2048286 RepID=UPI001E58AEB9|nr:hypothetical protein [Cryobacterium sp. Y50]